MTPRDQLMRPASSSLSNNNAWILSQVPSSCQSRSRRQQVIPLPQFNSAGKSSHPMPVLRTNKMPVNAARWGTGGRPPLGERTCGGRSGSISPTLHPVKDQPTLLRAFVAVAPELPDVDLLMVGDGQLRAELESLAVELRIAKRVKFLGIRTDIPELMRASDAFALTSLSEDASLTLLEAMASGLPVAVTAVGGNPEIVRHEREGLLFARGDVNACADALRRLFRDSELAERLGAAGRERVVERYQLSRTVEEYYKLYCRFARG